MKEFDYIVVGGGSGGIASARRAASYGARVAVIEARRLGGTCVNVGCIPKKLMYNAASVGEALLDAPSYGFAVERGRFDWMGVKERRDAAIERLVGIYTQNLDKDGIARFDGRARLLAAPSQGGAELEVNGERLLAPHVLLATGGYPRVPTISGAQLGITSNGFFELEAQPKRVALVGSGYIGVELAGILNALGSKVTLLSRQTRPLSHFDEMLQDELLEHLENSGVEFCAHAEPVRVVRADDGLLRISAKDKQEHSGFDCLIWAVGRAPASAGLGLSELGIETDEEGHVTVDSQQNTTVRGIYAVGDLAGKYPLTPVAVAAGRVLADRLFGRQPDARLVYENIPSVIFSHPPVGTVGLSERQARARFGDDVRIYRRRFTNLFYAMTPHQPKTAMKVVTQSSTDRLLGIHIIGRNADEILQGFSVAVQMGATKSDLDRTVAIHPTAAEELVTMR